MESLERSAEEAAVRWRHSVDNQKESRENLKQILTNMLETYSLTELAEITRIKRTTIYYIIWGKRGRNPTNVREDPTPNGTDIHIHDDELLDHRGH